jgi:PAS domain S-box-containing protein
MSEQMLAHDRDRVNPRWQAIVAFREGELHFRRLLETLPAGAYTCDRDGLITYFNQQAVKIWGRAPKLNDPADRFCGSFKLFSSDGAPMAHRQCWMALALQREREYNGREIIIEQPDGARLTVLAHANPMRDDAGKLVGAVNVLVDITDLKRAETALREADRRKDEFLATLAHELRNPLAPIRNGLALLRLAGAEAPAGVTDMLERQVQHLVRLVDDLLEVSRITRGSLQLRKERVSLSAIVDAATETCQATVESAGHDFTVALPSEPIVLDADPVRLTQVLVNLLNNACKYTNRGGHVWLTAQRESGQAVIRVRDDGIGIRREMLPRVFDIFAQVDRSLYRNNGGLGIGLAIVKNLVEMHGGSVTADSGGLGEGSEFTVRLPLAPH